jgi:hypothetical protein
LLVKASSQQQQQQQQAGIEASRPASNQQTKNKKRHRGWRVG